MGNNPSIGPSSRAELHARVNDAGHRYQIVGLADFSHQNLVKHGTAIMDLMKERHPDVTSVIELRRHWKACMVHELLGAVPFVYGLEDGSLPLNYENLRNLIVNLLTWTDGTQWGTCMDEVDEAQLSEVASMIESYPNFTLDVLLCFARINSETRLWGTSFDETALVKIEPRDDTGE